MLRGHVPREDRGHEASFGRGGECDATRAARCGGDERGRSASCARRHGLLRGPTSVAGLRGASGEISTGSSLRMPIRATAPPAVAIGHQAATTQARHLSSARSTFCGSRRGGDAGALPVEDLFVLCQAAVSPITRFLAKPSCCGVRVDLAVLALTSTERISERPRSSAGAVDHRDEVLAGLGLQTVEPGLQGRVVETPHPVPLLALAEVARSADQRLVEVTVGIARLRGLLGAPPFGPGFAGVLDLLRPS